MKITTLQKKIMAVRTSRSLILWIFLPLWPSWLVPMQSLYIFLKVIDKGIADGTLSDKRDHIISPGTRYFTCHYLKTSIKKYLIKKIGDLTFGRIYYTWWNSRYVCGDKWWYAIECQYLQRFDSEIKTFTNPHWLVDVFFLLIFVDI